MAALQMPDDFPLLDLVGQEVTQICLGIGQIQLHFYAPIASSNPKRWELIIKAASLAGLNGDDDLTEEWREW